MDPRRSGAGPQPCRGAAVPGCSGGGQSERSRGQRLGKHRSVGGGRSSQPFPARPRAGSARVGQQLSGSPSPFRDPPLPTSACAAPVGSEGRGAAVYIPSRDPAGMPQGEGKPQQHHSSQKRRKRCRAELRIGTRVRLQPSRPRCERCSERGHRERHAVPRAKGQRGAARGGAGAPLVPAPTGCPPARGSIGEGFRGSTSRGARKGWQSVGQCPPRGCAPRQGRSPGSGPMQHWRTGRVHPWVGASPVLPYCPPKATGTTDTVAQSQVSPL